MDDERYLVQVNVENEKIAECSFISRKNVLNYLNTFSFDNDFLFFKVYDENYKIQNVYYDEWADEVRW